MTREEALKIIDEKQLKNFNWFDDHKIKEHEFVISFDAKNNEWLVYGTDERAAVYGVVSKINNESEALEKFIKKLKLVNGV